MLVKKQNKTKEHNNKPNQANKNEQPTNQTKQKVTLIWIPNSQF